MAITYLFGQSVALDPGRSGAIGHPYFAALLLASVIFLALFRIAAHRFRIPTFRRRGERPHRRIGGCLETAPVIVILLATRLRQHLFRFFLVGNRTRHHHFHRFGERAGQFDALQGQNGVGAGLRRLETSENNKNLN